jgi:type IV pilus assembly protein PilO
MDLSLNKLSWHVQVGIFVVLALAMVAVFYNFYVWPAEAEMASRQARLGALRTEINRGIVTARKKPEFEREVAGLEDRLEKLRTVLPEEKDVSDLLRRLQTMATQSSLTIRVFKPQPMKAQQLHQEWPIALELDGTYHNLGMFFDRVSKFSRIINVSEVAVKGKDTPEPSSTINAQCVATTFVLLSQSKPGAAPPVATKGT